MILNDKTYNILKHIVQIVLPASGTLYFALSGIWDFPNGEAVVGTIAAVTTFLGAVLGISSSSYYAQERDTQGALTVYQKDDGVDVYSLDLDKHPEELRDLNRVTFSVHQKPPAAQE